MKIKTEIIHSIFIITCDGPSLDASLAQEFLSAMGGFLQKSQMDILLDIQGLNFVDSTGLGSTIRSLVEINSQGRLILCGVNERNLSLLQMTHLEKTIRIEATREQALNSLFWDDGETEQTEKLLDDIEEVVTKDMEPASLSDLPDNLEIKEEIPAARQVVMNESITTEERRKYRRIEKKQIMDEELMIYCKNITTGRQHPGVVLNISPGGLLITTRSRLTIGDELLLEGRIGKLFKFKERAISRSSQKQKHGLEFINLSPETTHFLDRLTGSVDMIKSNRFHHDQPN